MHLSDGLSGEILALISPFSMTKVRIACLVDSLLTAFTT